MAEPLTNPSERSGRITDTVDPLDVVPSAFEPLPPGTVVAARYEIAGLLGRGGYSAVYRATDRDLKRDIALKIIRPERVSAATESRLRREVNVARAAQSRHLVRVFDLGSDAGMVFLTMELVDGESLREKIRREVRLGVTKAVEIAKQILRGLTVLHELKTIHRDIKPENVLIAADGTVKLADFGLARVLDDDQTRATVAGSVVGTADYLSPEQALGQQLDERTDLYSLGVVLFEMLTGELPFVRESSLGSMIARIGKPARPVRSIQRDVPYWLATVVSRLLDPVPGRRYPSAANAEAALERRHIDIRTLAPRTRTWIAALLVIVALAAVYLLAPIRPHHQFARLASNGDRGIVAIGRNGETLWQRDGVEPEIANRYALVRLQRNARPLLATVIAPRGEFALSKVALLSFLDPESGKLVRQVHLPDATNSFPRDAKRYWIASISSVDVDGDGIDEVFIGFAHVPEAPYFTVLYEPSIDRSRVLFQAVGHHHFAGLHDVDGDGRPEALFVGINTAFDWIYTLSAVRISPWIGDVASEPSPTSSPDMVVSSDEEKNLLWYTLLPRAGFPPKATEALSYDDKRRRITIAMSGRTIDVTMNGFLAGEPSRLDPRERNRRRNAAYNAYRESKRLFAVGAVDEALAEMSKAVGEASRTDEAILVEVMQRAQAALLVRTGHLNEGEALFQRIWRTSENASEIAYDAGVAYHLHGDLDRAISWYERGMGKGASTAAGKSKHEFVQAIVLALGELRRWNEASDAVERYRAAYVSSIAEAAIYDEYIRWRRGEAPRIDNVYVNWYATDVNRYWLLEFRLARGERPDKLLPIVEGEVNIGSQPQCIWRSLRAELMVRLGRKADAEAEASRAMDALKVERTMAIIARAHADIVEERFARIAGGKS
jgi:predicted Ser/Thr protein kinase